MAGPEYGCRDQEQSGTSLGPDFRENARMNEQILTMGFPPFAVGYSSPLTGPVNTITSPEKFQY